MTLMNSFPDRGSRKSGFVVMKPPAEASGVGTMPCETWTAVQPDHLAHRVELEQWVLGFFSGVGFAGAGNPLSERDAKAIWAWIDNYCQAHPHDHIAEAAAALDFELDKLASR